MVILVMCGRAMRAPTKFVRSSFVSAVYVCLRDEQFSLRLGHTRVLTCHWHVIHCARAASLRLSLQGEIKLPYENQSLGSFFDDSIS